MAERTIQRPQGLGISFSPGHAVGSPYGNSLSGMIAANKIIADTPNKLGQTLAGVGAGLKGLGSGLKDFRDEQQQSQMRDAMMGGPQPSVWDKIGATLGHAADGTLGQHANDRVAIRPGGVAMDPRNISIGADGRYHYDPSGASRAALDAEKLKQATIDSARMKREEDAQSNPKAPRQFFDGKPVPTKEGDASNDKDPLPKKDMPSDGPMPGSNTASAPLYPGSSMQTGDVPATTPGQIQIPGVGNIPGVTQAGMAQGTSPLADNPTATATAQPAAGSFDYTQSINPVALNEAVTPGGAFSYSSSPLSGNQMLGPGDVYNNFDATINPNSIASSFGPAPFNFESPDAGANQGQSDQSSQYAGQDYSSPMSDQQYAAPDASGDATYVPTDYSGAA